MYDNSITQYQNYIILGMMKVNIKTIKMIITNARVRARMRSNTRAKFKNAQNLLITILHMFQAIWSIFQKIAHTQMRARFYRA